MSKIFIKLNPEEVVCLLFWYSVFKDQVIIDPDGPDKKLFTKLYMHLLVNIKDTPLQGMGISGSPTGACGPMDHAPGDSGEGE